MVCDSLGEVTVFYAGNGLFAAHNLQGTQVTLLLGEVTGNSNGAATGEVLLHVVFLQRKGSGPVDET